MNTIREAYRLLKRTCPGDKVTIRRDGFYCGDAKISGNSSLSRQITNNGLPLKFERTVSDNPLLMARYLRSSYRSATTNGSHFKTDRGMREYLKDLPLIPNNTENCQDKAFQNIMEYLFDRVEQALLKGKGKVRVLDVGCGRGDFILEACEILANKYFHGDISELIKWVDTVGLSLQDFRDSHSGCNDKKKTKPPTRDRLDRYGIRYYVGDMMLLPGSIGPDAKEKYDCIISSYTICYVAGWDKVEVLEHIYGMLKKNGVAVLSGTGSFWPILSVHDGQIFGTDDFYVDIRLDYEAEARQLSSTLKEMGLEMSFSETRHASSLDGTVFMRNNSQPFPDFPDLASLTE